MNDNITTRNCPKAFCKGRLVIRTNKASGQKFLGCENFPECRYTEPIEEGDEYDGVEDTASRWDPKDNYGT